MSTPGEPEGRRDDGRGSSVDPLQPVEGVAALLGDIARLCELIVGLEGHLADGVKQLEQRVNALAAQIRAGRGQ
jgi:hypothetical protein